jgi:hypothetical protein
MMATLTNEILAALLALIAYRSGFLFWPLRRLFRGPKKPGKSLRGLFLAQLLAYAVVGCCMIFVKIQHFYGWFFLLIMLNLIFTIAAMVALCWDAFDAHVTAPPQAPLANGGESSAVKPLLVLALLACALASRGAELTLSVENSGSKEVDALVLQLVSSRPAPYPSNSSQYPDQQIFQGPCMTAEVSRAMARLTAMGPRIFPALIKHLNDDRYSFSIIVASWNNLTVGDAVETVLSDDHFMFSGYKIRHTPKGVFVYPNFHNYLKARNPEKWAAWAQDKTRTDIMMDFIDWCVEQEKEQGFQNDFERDALLKRYEEARAKVKAEYSTARKGKSKTTTAPTPASIGQTNAQNSKVAP